MDFLEKHIKETLAKHDFDFNENHWTALEQKLDAYDSDRNYKFRWWIFVSAFIFMLGTTVAISSSILNTIFNIEKENTIEPKMEQQKQEDNIQKNNTPSPLAANEIHSDFIHTTATTNPHSNNKSTDSHQQSFDSNTNHPSSNNAPAEGVVISDNANATHRFNFSNAKPILGPKSKKLRPNIAVYGNIGKAIGSTNNSKASEISTANTIQNTIPNITSFEVGVLASTPLNSKINLMGGVGLKRQYLNLSSSKTEILSFHENQGNHIISTEQINTKTINTDFADILTLPLSIAYNITPKHSFSAGICNNFVIAQHNIAQSTTNNTIREFVTIGNDQYLNNVLESETTQNIEPENLLKKHYLSIATAYNYKLSPRSELSLQLSKRFNQLNSKDYLHAQSVPNLEVQVGLAHYIN